MNRTPAATAGTWLYYAPPLALLALFANKPFHIDDPLFLRMGELLPWTLLGDASGQVRFMGVIYEQLSAYESTHPVLIPYLLKWVGLLQWGDYPVFWTYHLVFLLFPALTLWFAADLARTLDVDRRWGWLLALSPVFFVNAANLMTDVPMLAFWTGAVAMAARYGERGERADAARSAVCLGLALLTSFQSAALFPLLAAFLWARGRLDRTAALGLAAPALAFALYLAGVYLASGYFPFLASGIELNIGSEVSSGLGWQAVLHKLTSVLINLGLALLFAAPLLALGQSPARLALEGVSALALAGGVFWLAAAQGALTDYPVPERWLLFGLALVGSWWTARVVAETARQWRGAAGDRRRAGYAALWFLWFGGVLFYNVTLMPYGISRYLLPALPPALLLVFAGLSARPRPARVPVWAALSAALALLMAAVDYRQARGDWLIAAQVREIVGDGRIWYSDDGGLGRYLQPSDAHYLPRDLGELPVGDWVLATRGLIDPGLADSLTLDREIAVPAFAGLTLFDTQKRAGFYRSYDGLLPMAFADTARRASLYRVDLFKKMRDRAVVLAIDNANYHSYRTFDLGEGGKKGVMFLHARAKVAYPVEFGAPMRLRGKAVGSPGDWPRAGDGVAAAMGALTPAGETTLWTGYLDGKSLERDRKPRVFEVLVPADATHVWFSAEPGPNGDVRYDGLGWFDLSFERAPSDRGGVRTP